MRFEITVFLMTSAQQASNMHHVSFNHTTWKGSTSNTMSAYTNAQDTVQASGLYQRHVHAFRKYRISDD